MIHLHLQLFISADPEALNKPLVTVGVGQQEVMEAASPIHLGGRCSLISSSAHYTFSSMERPMLAMEILASSGLRMARWTRDLS
jgi:hypothetical protein